MQHKTNNTISGANLDGKGQSSKGPRPQNTNKQAI